jgi:autotransporter strand-loop-strand O-heptosyltransferase
MQLGLTITVAGPKNNSEFFAENKWALEYPNLFIVSEPDEEELVYLYSSHKLFLNPSILEAGHPNLTLLEAMACGTPVLATIEKETELPGIYRIERDVDQIVKGIEYVLENYDYYNAMALQTATELNFKNITHKLANIYGDILKPKNMKDSLIKLYEETPISDINVIKQSENQILCNFVNGATLEIVGSKPANYVVEFINQETNIIEYKAKITTNHWCKSNKKYFVNWLINVYEDGELIHSHKFDAKDKRVYIAMDSKAIGDTIAWFPFVDEFRKAHNCEVIVSTFHNDWFEANYPEIEFVNPSTEVHNLYAMYKIGWFYNDDNVNYDMNRVDFKAVPLQQTATSILGLPAAEIKPRLAVPAKKTKIEGKYVVIAPHASTHAKYWNAPGGWQAVINWLNAIGYKVVMITSEKLGNEMHDSKLGGTLTGVIDKTGDIKIQERMVDIRDADLFIGVGSGLSWLSWALGTKTILISGFSDPYSEFTDCVRIFTNRPYTCSGCYNKRKLNAGDWDWCPEHKGTSRQFECTKTIESQQIITEINDILL